VIEDLRFVEREVADPIQPYGKDYTIVRTVKILQAYDGHVWFDVPLVTPPIHNADKE